MNFWKGMAVASLFLLSSAGAAGTVPAYLEKEIGGDMPMDLALQQMLGILPDEVGRRQTPGTIDPYLPGLVLSDPKVAASVERRRRILLEMLRNEGWKASRRDWAGLRRFIEGMPSHGRLRLEKTDPRWLEANSKYNPMLRRGQKLRLPHRPDGVTVLTPAGTVCRARHFHDAWAGDYLATCGVKADADVAWVVQPDGVVQKHGVAAWNAAQGDAPAPGAWVLYAKEDDPETILVLKGLLPLLSDHGPLLREDAPVQQVNTHVLLPAAPDKGAHKYRDAFIGYSNWGSVGLIQTPTARMQPAGDVSGSHVRVAPYRWTNITLQPFDWFEGAFRYIDIENHAYGLQAFSGDQSYKDKSIDFKLRLLSEGEWWPQLAVGVRDIGGTGLFAGEYLVASKRYWNTDWSLGLGWGYLGGRGNLGNPFSLFSSKFDVRPAVNFGLGGTVSMTSMFRGPTSLFGGVQYQTPWPSIALKLEYDGNDYHNQPQSQSFTARIPFNFGITYRYSPEVEVNISYERGDVLGLGLVFHGRLDRMFVSKVNDPVKLPVLAYYPERDTDWTVVTGQLQEATGWSVLDVSRSGTEVLVKFQEADAQYWNGYIDRVAAVLHRHIRKETLVFRIQAINKGLPVREYLVDRRTWLDANVTYMPLHRDFDGIHERDPQSGFLAGRGEALFHGGKDPFSVKSGLSYNQSLGGPDGFLLYQFGWAVSTSYFINPKTWIDGMLHYRLIDNYDGYKVKSNSKLPHVRTEYREYAVTSELTLPELRMTHVNKLAQGQYYSLYAGMLERMFGGFGGEWMNWPWGSRLALGVDLNLVRQRAYDQGFAFKGYSVATGHASAYYDTGIQDIQLALKFGRYLAGDVGATFDMSREFNNGVKMGAYFTLTNVSAAEFGEGSFDKGIYVQVPFDAFLTRSTSSVANVQWQPIVRDGGAILRRSHGLYDLLKGRSGKALRYRPISDPPGYYPNLEDMNNELVEGKQSSFSAFLEDTRQLPASLSAGGLWTAGGVTLLSALLDRPLDNLMRDHSGNRGLKAATQIGDGLPILTLGFSAAMALGAEDPKMVRTSTASLEAAALGTLVSVGAKYLTGRSRPEEGGGPAQFQPLKNIQDDTSFPSLRTTLAWAAVTPYAKAYDAPWLYGVALATNFSRVSGRKHWLSDTVASSFIGYTLGSYFLDRRKTSRFVPNFFVRPGEVNMSWAID